MRVDARKRLFCVITERIDEHIINKSDIHIHTVLYMRVR